MMFLLAQNVPPGVSGGWLWGAVGVAVGLGAVLFCWNQGMKALDRFTGRNKVPQPMQTQEVHTFVTRPELDKHISEDNREHEKLWSKLGGMELGANQRLSEAVQDFNDKLQAMPHEIVTLLRNTGVIK